MRWTAAVFEVGTDVLKKESNIVLGMIVGSVQDDSDIAKLRIAAHTDNQGAAEPNMTLSQKRAMTVACAFVQSGVDCNRLQPVGFGETKPIASNADAEGRARNRRIDFVIGERHSGARFPIPSDGKLAGNPCL